MFALDHLAVAGCTLDDAVAHVEAALGVRMAPGGKHPAMGTHNRLLSLGPGVYLEAIAVDPGAQPPDHPRWFDLDDFSGPPRLMNWIARTDNLSAALASAPAGVGLPVSLSRGDFSWTMAVPPSGRLPYEGAVPALIEWHGAAHPADRLPASGCTLLSLEIFHPAVERILADYPALAGLDGVSIKAGQRKELKATIDTPEGPRLLA